MKAVFTPTKGMTTVDTSYCPGCTHGIAHRIIMEVLDEMGLLGQTIGVAPIGCAINAHHFMNIDMCESMHGRAPAVASGIRRANPGKVVFTYQGDGDLAAIGIAEITHAALRGEKFTTFFINNGIYGMTGGQMAPTTLIGMKATTAPKGRDPKEHGYPMHMCEIMNQLTAPYYLERTSCNNPANVRKTKAAIKKAFLNQLEGKGFSMVEIVTNCPTNWGTDALGSLEYLEQNMLKEFPLGVIRDKSLEEEGK